MKMLPGLLLLGLLLSFPFSIPAAAAQEAAAAEAEPGVLNILRCPDGGIRPLVRRDGLGIFHMVYLGAVAAETDVFYTRSTDGGVTFASAIRVNSTPGSVDATDVSHDVNLAFGRDGRIHVVWAGSAKVKVEVEVESEGGASELEVPLLYARLSDDKQSFSPERNLIQSRWGLRATPAVAADAAGNVFVFWHAPGDDAPVPAENQKYNDRRVFMAVSADDGQTFAPGRAIDRKRKGAAENCGLDADIDDDGTIYVIYRCSQTKRKDMRLLYSPSGGEVFGSSYVDTWRRKHSPRSAGSLKRGHNRLMVSWETEGQVFTTMIARKTNRTLRPLSPKSKPDDVWRQQPMGISSGYNVALIVWLEGTVGQEPSRIGWRTFDVGNYSPIDRGMITDVPPGARPEVFVGANDRFTIVY
jgi:hypothetical protein